jgi:hypothetical protein
MPPPASELQGVVSPAAERIRAKEHALASRSVTRFRDNQHRDDQGNDEMRRRRAYHEISTLQE